MSSSLTTCGSTSADFPPFLIGADFAADFLVPAFTFDFLAMLSSVWREFRTADCTRGREMAKLMGARLVALESENHILLPREPAYTRFMEEVLSFLRGM